VAARLILDLRNGLNPEPVCTLGMLPAHFGDKLRQGGIYFIEQQRSTRAGASMSDVAPVYNRATDAPPP
jgi:hypothetical protein